jgi:benzoyl-CoA reductase subunit C
LEGRGTVEASLKERFDRAWQEAGPVIAEIKKLRRAKAVGLVLTDAPHELVHAAGALPVTLLGRDTSFTHADRRMQNFACAYSRGVVELAESGRLDFLDGIIVPYACDTTRCLDLMFKYLGRFAFNDCLRLPKRNGAEGAAEYFKGELERLAGSLGAFTGVGVTEERLFESIGLYNRVRALLAKVKSALRSGADDLSYSEYLAMVRTAMVLPPEDSLALLEEAVKTIKPGPGNREGDLRVILAGKVPEPPGVVDLIEGSGLRIVEDHLVVGGRWISATVGEDRGPFEALVERQFSRLPFAGIWDERPSRASHLVKRLADTGADGAIFLIQKFCEPAEMDWPGIKEEIEKTGTPILLLESDYRPESLEPIRTRVEAFAEMVRAKKIG